MHSRPSNVILRAWPGRTCNFKGQAGKGHRTPENWWPEAEQACSKTEPRPSVRASSVPGWVNITKSKC